MIDMSVQMRAHQIVLDDAPPGGVLRSVRLAIEIEPASGAVLVYGAPNYSDPVRVNGPRGTVDLPTTEPTICVQLISGAQSFSLGVLSHVDVNARKFQFKDAPLTIHKGNGPGNDIEIG